MPSIKHHNCLTLVLLLLLGHAMLTLHVTTHIPVDQTSCEYCAGNGNPAHAIPTSASDLRPLPVFKFGAVDTARVARLAEFIAYRERAPPTLV